GTARPMPLALTQLFTGTHSPDVRVTKMQYASVEGQALWLDLYQPLRIDHPLPGIVVVHGGSWQNGDRGEFPALNRYLAARGNIVASIDYRLAPAAVFPAQREDLFSAIAYLKHHAQTIGLDPARLVILGRSAGGQIALSAAYGQQIPGLKGVIVFYAPNDLE